MTITCQYIIGYHESVRRLQLLHSYNPQYQLGILGDIHTLQYDGSVRLGIAIRSKCSFGDWSFMNKANLRDLIAATGLVILLKIGFKSSWKFKLVY